MSRGDQLENYCYNGNDTGGTADWEWECVSTGLLSEDTQKRSGYVGLEYGRMIGTRDKDLRVR